jgi:hypothetical protein
VKSLQPQLTNANKNGTTTYSFDIWWILRVLERTGVLYVWVVINNDIPMLEQY